MSHLTLSKRLDLNHRDGEPQIEGTTNLSQLKLVVPKQCGAHRSFLFGLWSVFETGLTM
jgi:hypothetical protein